MAPTATARRNLGAAAARPPLGTLVPPRLPHLMSFNQAFTASPVQAQKFTLGLLTGTRPGLEKLKDTAELVNAISATGDGARRRTVVAAFREAKAELALVHEMALLPADQAEAFIADYLADGGSLDPVLQWLGMAGAALNAPRSRSARSAALAHWATAPKAATRGAAPRSRAASRGWLDDLVGAVGGAIHAVGNAIGDAVNSVVNAVVKAGKSVADAIGAAINWSVAQLTDLVKAFLRAGKRVADILAAALTKGLAQLNKFVDAVLAAGRAIGEVLAWAATQVASAVQAVVARLLQLGKAVLDVIKSAVALGRAALVSIMRGLLAAGRTLSNVLAALAGQVYATVKAAVDALLEVGQRVRDVLAEAARQAAAFMRPLVQALVELGRAVRDLLVEAAAAAGTVINAVVKALLEIGRSLAEVLVAAAALAAATVKIVVQALLAIGRTVAELVLTVAAQAVAVAKAILGALLAAGRKLAEFLVAVAGRAVALLRTVMEALLALNTTLGVLVAEICTQVAEGFRQGFFQGLVMLGKTPLMLLKAAAEASVSVLLLAFAVVLEMSGGYRPLSSIPGAMDQASKVFGKSVRLDKVLIGFAQLPGDVVRYLNIEMPRAFTTMYLLNFGPGAKVDMQTIIHELAHVWQGVQQGPLYMTRALEAQFEAGLDSLMHHGHYDDSASYLVTNQMLKDAGGDFSKFNPEQQATIIEAFWIARFAKEASPPYPTTELVGGFKPPIELLLPYARAVNPALRLEAALQVLQPVRPPVRPPTLRRGRGAASARRRSAG